MSIMANPQSLRRRRLPVAPLLAAAVMLAAACPLAVHAQGDADGRAAGEAPASVDEQLAALRQDLANTKLQLDQARSQLEELQQFLADYPELEEKLADWKAERAALAKAVREMRAERVRLEKAREALSSATMREASRRAAEEREAAQAAAAAAKPRWSAQYMMGLIHEDQPNIYVKATSGRVLVDRYPDIDRNNIMVRGTFLNQSTQSYRYTFEVRAAGDEGIGGDRNLVGSWRYQTPVLGPGELHEFEVKMPVKNVAYVEEIQVGNVTADQPESR